MLNIGEEPVRENKEATTLKIILGKGRKDPFNE